MLIARSLVSPTLKCLGVPLPQSAGSFNSGDRLVLISVWVYHQARKLTLPRYEFVPSLSKVKNEFTCADRIICKDIKRKQKLEFRYAKQPAKDFCSFFESTPKAEIVAFFRGVAEAVEERCQLEDFHMKITNGDKNFRVDVFYGAEKTGPEPLAIGQCISCFADVPLYPGLEPRVDARECILEEFCDQPYVLCRLDAKARPGFVITPVRHVERMSDLNNEELFSLWNVAVRALRHAEIPFISMILNHGSYRNLHHLHLKVWVDSELHKGYQKKWNDNRKEVWSRLLELSLRRPKRQEECWFFKAHNWCRHGDLCSFLHVSKV